MLPSRRDLRTHRHANQHAGEHQHPPADEPGLTFAPDHTQRHEIYHHPLTAPEQAQPAPERRTEPGC